MTPTAPAADLTTVIDRWADLRHALADRTPAVWPPAGRMSDYLAQLDAEDAALVRAEEQAERAERNALGLGEHPVPLRLPVLDTIRTVEAALVACADQIASSVQRPPVAAPAAGRGWTDELHRTVSLLAARDAADPARWRFRGARTAPVAARWLAGRLAGGQGPFRPLAEVQRRHIAAVAREAARRIETALGIGRTARTLDRPCPRCGGVLSLQSGGAGLPSVECAGCGWGWTGHELADLWRRLDPAA